MNFLGMKIQSSIIRSDYFLFSHLSRFLDHMPGSHIWKLCYRASSHSWDGMRHTVTIIRKNQYVFGGYHDIPWGMYAIKKMSHLFNCVAYSKWQKQKAENSPALILQHL